MRMTQGSNFDNFLKNYLAYDNGDIEVIRVGHKISNDEM